MIRLAISLVLFLLIRANQSPGPAGDNGAFDRAPREVQNALRRHFPGNYRTMAMIAECESGFRSTAHCSSCFSGIREDSRGILQVNVLAHPRFAAWNLYSPDVNARAARIIFDAQGYGAWRNCSERLGIL